MTNLRTAALIWLIVFILLTITSSTAGANSVITSNIDTTADNCGGGEPQFYQELVNMKDGGGEPQFDGGGEPQVDGGGEPQVDGGGEPQVDGGGEPQVDGGGEPQ